MDGPRARLQRREEVPPQVAQQEVRRPHGRVPREGEFLLDGEDADLARRGRAVRGREGLPRAEVEEDGLGEVELPGDELPGVGVVGVPVPFEGGAVVVLDDDHGERVAQEGRVGEDVERHELHGCGLGCVFLVVFQLSQSVWDGSSCT